MPADLPKRPAHMFLTKRRFEPGQGHRVWLTVPGQYVGHADLTKHPARSLLLTGFAQD